MRGAGLEIGAAVVAIRRARRQWLHLDLLLSMSNVQVSGQVRHLNAEVFCRLATSTAGMMLVLPAQSSKLACVRHLHLACASMRACCPVGDGSNEKRPPPV